MHSQWNPRRQVKKILAILTGEIGYRTYTALSPEQRIRKCRNVAHMNAGANDAAARHGRRECCRHERTNRREYQRSVQQRRRRLVTIASPMHAELAGGIL